MVAEITGKFNWKTPSIIPSFVEGEDAKAIYDSIKELGLGWMDYDEKSQTLRGNTPFISAKVDSILRPLGIRVVNLGDLSRPEVMEMVKGRYYADTPAFVLRSTHDSYLKNLPLIERIAEEVEEKNGKLELPILVMGFDVVPWLEDDKGYKVNIVQREDFEALHDERLSGSYNGKRFSEVDELWLPKFDKNGNRTWYARQEGLSRLCLLRDLSLGSSSGYLASSLDVGRVVVVSGEATSQKIDNLVNRIREQKKAQIAEIEERAIKAENYVKTGKLE